MKKFVFVCIVALGITLFGLNYYSINSELLKNPLQIFKEGGAILVSKASENSVEVSKVILPSIFDALIKSLK